jgi:hypothetical protein
MLPFLCSHKFVVLPGYAPKRARADRKPITSGGPQHALKIGRALSPAIQSCQRKISRSKFKAYASR